MWLRRRLPAKKGSLSAYIEELIRREMRSERGEIDSALEEIDKLVVKRFEAVDLPKIRGELESILKEEV